MEATLFHLHTLSLQEWPICVLYESMDSGCLYPSLSKVCLEWEVKKTGVWSILMMYLFTTCLTYFFPYSFMKSSASDAASAGERWDSWVPSSTSILCLQPPVQNQWLCTIWFDMENLTQITRLAQHNSRHHYHSLLMKLEDISEKKIIKRHQ